MDPDGGVLGEVGEALLIGGHVDDAGPDVVGHTVAGEVSIRAGHPVARDGAEDDLRIDDAQVVEPDTAAGQGSRSHGLDHGIGRLHQLLQDGHALGRAQIEHQGALAPVEMEMHERDALDDGPGHLADVIARRRLDLDDVGPEVDQGRGDLGRAQGRALDDPHPV
jgi:hypothetical protein